MKRDTPLRFDFCPSEDAASRNDGWGGGALSVLGTPYWYSNTDAEPKPIEWTWIDLLEYVASNWGALMFEQSYPYPWLNVAAHPGDVWTVAERRWARLGDEVADSEEPTVLAFERRHNLASAWKGLSLPALTFMRNGNVCWICVDGRAPIRAPFDDCRSALVHVCEEIAQAFDGSTNQRVISAIERWRLRGEESQSDYFRWATGMPQQLLNVVQGGTDPYEFWGVAANDSWAEGVVNEGPLLAAARMTAGTFDTETIRRVVNAVRAVPKGSLDALDRLAAKASRQLYKQSAQFAFSEGYTAAEAVRGALGMDRPSRFDIEAVLADLKVKVTTLPLGAVTIDAVAVWGSRGPTVILNTDRQHTAPERTRMTLAHELGHLLLDRHGGLPFCDVLGGAGDEFMERRANAFAAELLLPRSSVEYARLTWKGTIGDFVADLKLKFAVSKSVACAQIYNSRVFATLEQREQSFVEARLQLADPIGSPYAIKVQPAGDVV